MRGSITVWGVHSNKLLLLLFFYVCVCVVRCMYVYVRVGECRCVQGNESERVDNALVKSPSPCPSHFLPSTCVCSLRRTLHVPPADPKAIPLDTPSPTQALAFPTARLRLLPSFNPRLYDDLVANLSRSYLVPSKSSKKRVVMHFFQVAHHFHVNER